MGAMDGDITQLQPEYIMDFYNINVMKTETLQTFTQSCETGGFSV